MDLELLLSMASSLDEDRTAVANLEGETLSTGQLEASASGAASIFRDLGPSRVAFCDTNGLPFPVALFGAVKARFPFVPLNYRLSDEQLGQIVQSDELTAVASPQQCERLRRLGVAQLIESEELLRSAATTDPFSEAPPIETDDVALLLYTSGTTGVPKAAILRHRHLAAYVINTVEFGSATADDATLLSVPPYHIAGVMNLLSNLYMGRRIVYLDSFSAERWMTGVREQKVTHAMVVPTMLARIVSAPDLVDADLGSLRTVAYGGARMPSSVIEKALRLFPDVAFTNAYGLTETSSTISVLGPEVHREALESAHPATRARLGSVGVPLPGIEIEIRDDDGVACEPGVSGNIFVRGDQVAGEYVGVGVGGEGGGWFATRDWGYVDEAGYLFVEGRTDDTIIRGGENISPVEIEEVLLSHDDVSDCAVVGIEDEEWGQRIGAAIVLAPGASVGPDELQSFARSNLRGAKTPEVIVVLDELPYTDTGKLLRRVVREQLSAVPATPSVPRRNPPPESSA
jgi:acyl-CoA synthetase (AMP-forming)/AMP-acid ligase II